MKKKANPPRPRIYSEQQLSGLHSSTSARKQETVERLHMAIESLKAKKQAISAQTIHAECGLHYASILRNPEAIMLFQANSTHLAQKKKQTKRQRKTGEDAVSSPPSRDPLLSYKKPQLVTRLREAQQRILNLEQQQAKLVDACLQRDAQVVELETKLTELEPYRNFVEQVRTRVRQEEHGSDQ